MAVSRCFCFECDDCGNTELSLHATTRPNARKEISQWGWQYKHGKDRCPACVKLHAAGMLS